MITCLLVATLAGSASATGWVEGEPNNDFSSAGFMNVGDTVSAQMTDSDQDVYAVEIVEQESMTIETNVGTGADIQISVYDPSGNHVKHWVQASGSGGEVTIPTPENGIYYLQVYTGQYANLVTNYSIAVSAAPYELNWEFVAVAITVLGGAYGLIRRRNRTNPVPA